MMRHRVWICRFAGAMLVVVTMASLVRADEVSFRRDVMAVLSKSGCNLGTCHGNKNGKGGFRLSLRGEDPAADFATLTHEQHSRRANSLDADRSLLLLKATMQLPHEGGRRFNRESPEYAILQRWIVAGMPASADSEPRVIHLSVTPNEQVVSEPANVIGLKVVATFSDRTTRDVTRLTCFEPSQPIVSISPDGVVTRERFGEVTIVARFLDQQVPVRLAFIAAHPDFEWKAPTPRNLVDEAVFGKLRLLRMNPSDECDDATFLRRTFLDLLGTRPSAAEAQAFASDQSPDKRDRLIENLLRRPEYADFWAIKWADLFRVEEKTLDRKGVATFHAWLRDAVATNKPLDEFARDLIAARGSTYEHPPSNFYRAMRDPLTRSETVAQVFLGIRLQCAKCHSHPFDRWTQDDYYGWANQFARIKYEVLENNRRDRNDSHEFDGEQLVLHVTEGDVKHPVTGQPASLRLLVTIPKDDRSNSTNNHSDGSEVDRLLAVARWLTSKQNRRFAEAQVNRVWFHLMGRGIVDPIDDFRATNPPSNPQLLAALTDDFVEHGFDVQRLIRVIMSSRTYQLSSQPNESNREDELNFSHVMIRRLSAEQLADSIGDVLNVRLTFNGYPTSTRAAQLAGVRAFRPRETRPSTGDAFLVTFGKPPRLQACECERSEDTTLAQTFQLVSGPILNDMLSREDNRLADWMTQSDRMDALIENLFWTVLGRPAQASEASLVRKLLSDATNRRGNLEDVVWSLLNSDEFLLRR